MCDAATACVKGRKATACILVPSATDGRGHGPRTEQTVTQRADFHHKPEQPHCAVGTDPSVRELESPDRHDCVDVRTMCVTVDQRDQVPVVTTSTPGRVNLSRVGLPAILLETMDIYPGPTAMVKVCCSFLERLSCALRALLTFSQEAHNHQTRLMTQVRSLRALCVGCDAYCKV